MSDVEGRIRSTVFENTKYTIIHGRLEDIKAEAYVHSTNSRGDKFENSKAICKLLGKSVIDNELKFILNENKG